MSAPSAVGSVNVVDGERAITHTASASASPEAERAIDSDMSTSCASISNPTAPQHADTLASKQVALDQRSRWHLYASYGLAAWGDRMWEFASVVFLLDLFPGNDV